MIFRQLIHDDLGCASYLIGDENEGVAAVVDPKLDIDEYLRLARYLGVHIDHVLETHNHADHVSGHGRLVAATGARIHIHREAAPEYDHEPFGDGWELELGSLTVRALHTPGHRPEHTAFALVDKRRSDEPWAVLSGDSLFVGDIARPDLAVDKDEGARGIFRSLNDKLLSLPDTTEVWPGHLGGSLCGGPGMDLKVSSTIGFERAAQELLRVDDEDEFVERTTAKLGPQPPNFHNIVALNRGPLVKETVEAHPLTPRQVEQAQAEGALVVDVRTDLQYDEAHIPGAVCNTARRAGFGSKLAWIAEAGQPLVLVGRDNEDALESAELAGAVGLRTIGGYLAGGMTSWREERLPVERVERMTVDELHEQWQNGGIQILDVREQSEWNQGHIPGSVHEPYHDIHAVPDGVDADRPVAAICGSGQRAAVAASMLKHHGLRDVIHVVDGGVPAWRRRGWPVEESELGRRARGWDDAHVAYDEDLANRIRELVHPTGSDVTEKRMFGGLAFLVGGHMAVAASSKGGLMVRVAPEETDALAARPHAGPFEMRGKPMRGWLRIDAEGVRTKRQLEPWVKRGVAYARSLPAKG